MSYNDVKESFIGNSRFYYVQSTILYWELVVDYDKEMIYCFDERDSNKLNKIISFDDVPNIDIQHERDDENIGLNYYEFLDSNKNIKFEEEHYLLLYRDFPSLDNFADEQFEIVFITEDKNIHYTFNMLGICTSKYFK
ncbi:hypothetical protein JD969_04505 [Planctomycetota bacterium]|nr:hypothetical protein JD969_04505 [Planctomycetota bacterium]